VVAGVLSLRSVLFNFRSNSHVFSIIYNLVPFHYHKRAHRYIRFPREGSGGRESGAVEWELAIGETSGLVLLEATDCSTTTTTTTTTTHRLKISCTYSAV
jgi:hypothetical protein